MPPSRDTVAVDASRGDVAVKTGTEWYSFELLRALAAIPDRPALTLYHRDSDGGWVDGVGVRHRRIDVPRLWTHIGLSGAMVRDRPRGLFVPSHVIPLLHPRASVVTVHDLGYLRERAAHSRSTRAMLDLTTRWNALAAAHIIAVSGATADDLVSHYRVNRAKIRVVHSGVRLDRFQPVDSTDVLERLGISRPYLLFVGTVQPRKNIVRLVEAFETLPGSDVQLVIAGKTGWLAEPIEQRIRSSPAARRIVRLGYVESADLPALYSGAAAFVLPSLYEGFGMPVLEAMACGTPVITSDVSSLPEIAGDAAVLVDPHDPAAIARAMQRVLAPDERERLREAGLCRAATFTWDRTARETLAVIREAMGDG